MLPLFLSHSAAAGGINKQYDTNRMPYYAPRLLPSVEDASEKLRFLQPQLYAIYNKGLVAARQIAVDQNGINVYFSASGVNVQTQYFWGWGGGYNAPVYQPYQSDYTASIHYGEVRYAGTNASHTYPGYYWVSVYSSSGECDLATSSVENAHMLLDAIMTLTLASGNSNFHYSDFELDGVTPKELKRLKLDVAFTVSNVQKDGPADTAGLKDGDIVVGVNGGSAKGIMTTITDGEQTSPSGYTVHLKVLRDKETLEIAMIYRALWTTQQYEELKARTAALVRANAAPPGAASGAAAPAANGVSLGVRAHNITASEAQAAGLTDAQGIFIEQVAAGSLAEQARMLPGDVVLALDGKPAVTIEAMKAILQSGAPSNIKVWRHGEVITLTLSQSL